MHFLSSHGSYPKIEECHETWMRLKSYQFLCIQAAIGFFAAAAQWSGSQECVLDSPLVMHSAAARETS